MKKFFLCLVLLGLFSLWSTADVQQLNVSVYKQSIVLNGVKTDSSQLSYPFLYYKDVVYMPLSTEFGKLAGFAVNWNDAAKEMTVTTNVPGNVAGITKKVAHNPTMTGIVTGTKIVVNGKPAEFNGFPVLVVKDVTYVPLTWDFTSNELKWQSKFHPVIGLLIQSDSSRSIEDVLGSFNLKQLEAMAAFMRTKNSSLTVERSLELARIFKNAAEQNGIDEKWLMAVCWKESNFNTGSVSSHGAVGAMQIMETTGRNYGYTKEQLLNPEINIGLGARYLAGLQGRYNGNTHIASIAYNQGAGRVDRGSYTTGFGDDVMSRYEKIATFLASKVGN